jgi:hypothetical protein
MICCGYSNLMFLVLWSDCRLSVSSVENYDCLELDLLSVKNLLCLKREILMLVCWFLIVTARTSTLRILNAKAFYMRMYEYTGQYWLSVNRLSFLLFGWQLAPCEPPIRSIHCWEGLQNSFSVSRKMLSKQSPTSSRCFFQRVSARIWACTFPSKLEVRFYED